MASEMLPRCEIRSLVDDEGDGYLVEFPDYPGCIADGATPEETMTEGRDALTAYIRTLEELGRPIPSPEQEAYRARCVRHLPVAPNAKASA